MTDPLSRNGSVVDKRGGGWWRSSAVTSTTSPAWASICTVKNARIYTPPVGWLRGSATLEEGKLVQFDVARGMRRNHADDVGSAR